MNRCSTGFARVVTGLIACGLAPAFAGPATEAPIATDRPGNGNAATTVPRARLQVEASASYLFERAAGASTQLVSFPTALRYGVLDSVELRVGSSLAGIELATPNGSGALSLTDGFVGAKLQLWQSRGARPNLASTIDVFIPLGAGAFTSDTTIPEARLAASWALPASFGLLVNVGADLTKDAGGRYARLVYVTNLSYAPPVLERRLIVFAESFGRIAPGDRARVIQIDAGAALLFGADWQLDLFTQHGLSDGSPDFQLALGLSHRI